MNEKRFRKLLGFIKDNTCEKGDVEGVMDLTEIEDMLNELYEENKYLKKRIRVISDELYCKDRKLEELGVPIECCDKK